MMKKRLLASLLAAAMTLTMAPAAFASEIDEQSDNISIQDITTSDNEGTPAEIAPTVGVAQVGDKTYASLEDAFNAAKPDEATTITLTDDVTLSNYISIKDKKDIVLDLNDHSITHEGNYVFVVSNAKFHVTGTGTIFENQRNGYAPIIAKGSPDDVTDYTTVTIDEDVTLKGDYAGIFVAMDTQMNSYNNYGLVINMKGSIDLTTIKDGVSGFGVYVNGLNKVQSGNIMQINLDGARIKTGSEAVYAAGYAKWNIQNCEFNAENAAIEIRAGEMTIDGGTYTATAPKFEYEANGNGSTTQGAALAIMQHTTKLPISVNVKKGTFKAAAAVAEKNVQKNDPEPDVDLQIADGQFNGVVVADDVSNFISGGYFTTDPSAYCVAGKTGVKSGLDGYAWTVGTLTVDENDGKVGTEIKSEKTTAQAGEGVDQKDAEQIKVQPEIKAEVSSDEKDAAVTELVRNGLTSVDENGKVANTVTITKKTYLDVKVTSYELTGEENTYKIAMDITPKYNLIATSDKDSSKEVTVASGAELKNVGATKVSVTLPLVFANKKIYIDHNNGQNVYVATAGEDGTVEFTTNGFSPFTFALTNPNAVVEVNGSAYKTLQEAADAASDGAEIIVNSGDSHKLDFTATKSVKITNKTGAEITVKFNGTDKKVAKDAIETFTYTRPSSGSSSGGSSSKTTYKVTTSSVANGGVNVSPSSSAKGDKVKITLSPNKGYKLDKLTVTDASGKTVSTTKTSDTVYTFTMPASQVTVGVTYVKAEEPTEQPSTKTFSDVSSSDWFADAVKYVSDKGMMNGTGTGKFSPADSTTRAMLMTVIARYAGEDTTGSNPWYQKGMEWAKANGVSDGTAPNANITREQLVTMLYRYAKSTGKDVSVGEDTNILSYADATTVSEYAIPAMQWACGAGIINGANGKLNPQNNATRAEVAAILMRFCENVK